MLGKRLALAVLAAASVVAVFVAAAMSPISAITR